MKRILGGIGRIAFAPLKNGAYETPVEIEYTKKVEMELKYETEELWGNSRVIYRNNSFGGGEGELAVHALTRDEQSLLFGQQKVKGGLTIKDTDVAPSGALIFEWPYRGGTDKRLYVVYNVQFKPCPIAAETVEEGKTPEALSEIEFAVGADREGLIALAVDTFDETLDEATITKWFTEVQMPEALPPTPAKVVKVVKEK